VQSITSAFRPFPATPTTLFYPHSSAAKITSPPSTLPQGPLLLFFTPSLQTPIAVLCRHSAILTPCRTCRSSLPPILKQWTLGRNFDDFGALLPRGTLAPWMHFFCRAAWRVGLMALQGGRSTTQETYPGIALPTNCSYHQLYRSTAFRYH